MTEMSVVASMFPPERTTATGPCSLDPAGEQRRHARRAGALDDELRPLEAEHDRLRDLPARDLDHGRCGVEDRARQAAELLHRDAVGDRESFVTRPHAHDASPGAFASAMPAASPPPPTGTTTVSTSSSCSASSSPTVPWPATTTGSSNAWMYVAPAASACSGRPARPARSPRRHAPRRRRSCAWPRPSPSARPAERRSWPAPRPHAPPRRPPGRGCRRSLPQPLAHAHPRRAPPRG